MPVRVSDGVRWTDRGNAKDETGRDPYLHPFAPESPWNLPVSNDAIFADNTERAYQSFNSSDAYIYMGAEPGEFTIPTCRAGLYAPWCDVFDETNIPDAVSPGGHFGIRIPEDAWPDTGTDSPLLVYDAVDGTAMEWHGIVRDGDRKFISWRQTVEGYFDTGSSVIRDITTQNATFNADNTINITTHEYLVGAPLAFSPPSSGTLPGEITAGVTYFVSAVVNGNKVKISTTKNGSSMTFSTGTGRVASGAGTAMLVQKLYDTDIGPRALKNAHGGFDRGATYYITEVVLDGDGQLTYRLAETENGAAVAATDNGYVRLMAKNDRKGTKGRVEWVDLHGHGIGPKGGSRAYEGAVFGGLIRSWEIDPEHPKYTGKIQHAIAMALGKHQMLYTGGEAGYDANFYGLEQGYVWPATCQDQTSANAYGIEEALLATGSTDRLALVSGHDHDRQEGDAVRCIATACGLTAATTYYVRNPDATTFQVSLTPSGAIVDLSSGSVNVRFFGGVAMGSYWVIPPSVDVGSLGLTAAGLMLATALQDYGAYVCDTSQETHTMAYVETGAPLWFREQLFENDRADLQTLRPLLRRVTNNSSVTPNGGALGSARRRPLIGALAT